MQISHRVFTNFEQSLRRLRVYLRKAIGRFGLPPYTFFVFSAVATGLLAGLAAVAFHNTIEFFRELFLGRSSEVIGFLGSLHIILLPAIGMLLQSAMIALWPALAARKGVVEVIKAVALRSGYIPLPVTLFHLIAPAICMGSGGTVGPEGPAAQIGAGVASRFGQVLGLPGDRRSIFTAAGAGAAIAAIFNTPLGGVFFALEIALLNEFNTGAFSAILLASVTASVISRVLLGNDPAFVPGAIQIGSYPLIFLYGLLGLCAGMIAVFFERYSDWLHHRFDKALRHAARPLLMAGVGLVVGICGYFFYDLLGIGYAGINRVLDGKQVVWMAAALLLLKFLLVPLTLEAGGFGGTFAPSLFMGAMLGLVFAFAVELVLPDSSLTAPANAYVLVGMGAMLAALNSVPLTAIMIIVEMVLDYSFILPLMLGVVGSTLVTRAAFHESIYARKLRQAGFRINSRPDLSMLQGISAKEIMQPGSDHVIPANLPLAQAVRICANGNHEAFYIQNENGGITGTISSAALRQLITEYEILKGSPLIAQDIADPRVVTVAENDDLAHVMQLFTTSGVDELPVVPAGNAHAMVGSIRKQHVIAVYHQALLHQDLSAGFARSLRTLEKTERVHVGSGYAMLEIAVPLAFVGKTLAELRLRQQYGVSLIMIRRPLDPLQTEHNQTTFMPDATYRFQEGDVMGLFGEEHNLAQMQKM